MRPELSETVPCVGCGALFPKVQGPTHRYMESSPGCWGAFGNVVAKEYSTPEYSALHRITVDAYAVQHPGRPSPQSIQSVALHLISLCLVLERGETLERATAAMGKAAKRKARFVWLVPPDHLGSVTVADVFRAETATAHKIAVQKWGESAWSAWWAHHSTVRQWLPV